MAAGRNDPAELAAALLRVESLAARLEAHTTADPALGRLWRAEAALTEAVRSVGLEDVHVREGDLMAKIAENRVTGPEGQGIAAARDVLRMLQAPGDLRNRPAETLARIERAGRFGATADATAPVGREADRAWANSHESGNGQGDAGDAGRFDGIAADLAAGPGTVLPALRVAGRVAGAMAPRHPIVERLAFVAADHALRRQASARPEAATHDRARADDDPLAEIGAAGQGAWVLLPATALSTDGFRAWAPRIRRGVYDLLDGLGLVLGREVGRLGELRHWTEVVAPNFMDGPRRGGRRALVGHLQNRPLVTAPAVAESLRVTGQTARNLVAAAESASVLVQVTRRARHRVWATPGLAQRLAARTRVRPRPEAVAGADAENGSNAALNAELEMLEVGVNQRQEDGRADTLKDEFGDAMAHLNTMMAPRER